MQLNRIVKQRNDDIYYAWQPRTKFALSRDVVDYITKTC